MEKLFPDIGAYRDDAEFQILLNLKLSIGQYAKAKTKALSRMATLRKVRNGEPHCGRVLYGYRYQRKAKDSPARLVVIPEQAKVIVAIYVWYIEGASLYDIVRRLIADGVPAPRSHWNTRTIGDILAERAYLGTWSYNKTESVEPETIRSTAPRHRRRSSQRARPESEWVGVPVEPIVTQEMFDAVATRRDSNPYTHGGRPSGKYRLKGLVFCGLCNTRFCGQPNHGRPRYACSNRDRVTGAMKCHAPSVMAEPLERTVLAAVEDVLCDERALEALVAKHRSELAAGVNGPEIEHLKVRLEQVRKRLDKARSEALKAAEIGDTEGEAFYDGEAREASAQRLELQSQLRAKTVVVDFRLDVSAIARAVRAGLRAATREQQKELLRGIIRRITYRDREAEIEFSIPVSGAQNRERQQPIARAGRRPAA
jgi:site-specific DNA recombinase